MGKGYKQPLRLSGMDCVGSFLSNTRTYLLELATDGNIPLRFSKRYYLLPVLIGLCMPRPVDACLYLFAELDGFVRFVLLVLFCFSSSFNYLLYYLHADYS